MADALISTDAESDDSRLIVCVDLNGVLDSYAGWRGPQHWDPPRAGAADFLRELRARGYRVVIHTTRWRDDAVEWLARHALGDLVDDVTNEKVAAHVFIDDRAVCFRGDFEQTLREVDGFKAHWER
jgi:phosphoglycolate phosphatase-like HAD superfamily hydrolase